MATLKKNYREGKREAKKLLTKQNNEGWDRNRLNIETTLGV